MFLFFFSLSKNLQTYSEQGERARFDYMLDGSTDLDWTSFLISVSETRQIYERLEKPWERDVCHVGLKGSATGIMFASCL